MQNGPIQSVDESTPVIVSLNPEFSVHQIDIDSEATAGSFEIDIATPGKPDVWQTLKSGTDPVAIAAPDLESLTGLFFFANRIRIRPVGVDEVFAVTVTSKE